MEPPPQVLEIANREGFTDFPKSIDIISIARVESRFDSKARNGKSHGIMQVNHGSFDLESNMKAGISLLRSLYLKLGSEKAAVIAYNIGIGNYLKRRVLTKGHIYFLKFSKHRSSYEQFTYRQQPSNDNNSGNSTDITGAVDLGEYQSPRGIF